MGKNLHVLLVNVFNRSFHVMPSLGLGYLAAAAREHGHAVEVLNCVKERMRLEGFARLLRERRFDVIGFQLFSYDVNAVRQHLALVRSIARGTATVAGGPHPSGDPEGTMRCLSDLDFGFQGEAETGFPLLLDRIGGGAVDPATIPGLVWRSGDDVVANPPCFVEDLDRLPLPAWDLLEPEAYPEAPHGGFTRRFPSAPIVVTRGCPFACTFCAGRAIAGSRIRRRSIDNVIQELRVLRGRGIREFHVEDEHFTADRAFVVEFCRRLRRERIEMTWCLPGGVRIDSLDAEMLAEMERSGLYSMALGIEFGAQRVMDLTRKRLSLGVVREKLRLFDGVKIKTTGFFIMGVPGETLEEMRETARFARELPLDRAQFNNFIPLPGSPLWRQLEAEGKLCDVDWDRLFVHDVAYVEPPLRASDIRRVQRNAYLRFYLRPKTLLRILGEVRSPRHLAFLVGRLRDVFF